jgi:glycosyltransferase involved in cell wall biosynthesis
MCDARAFSVLIPTFIPPQAPRRVEQLRCAITSIVEQKFDGPYEIILIDDGSPRPIAELLAGAPLGVRADIRCVRQNRGNGLVQALNRGLSEAKYDLIARLDDDDVWLPGKIDKQLRRLAADPELTILGTGMRLVFESGDPPADHVRPDGWSAILHFFCDVGCPFPHGSILARKDVFNLLGGYPQTAAVRHCEDYALWSVWVRFFKPGTVEEVLYDHSVSSNSITSLNIDRNREISRKVSASFVDLNINDTAPAAIEALAEVLGTTILQAGVVAFRLWHYGNAARLPKAAIAPLRELMPDRAIHVKPCDREPTSLSDLLGGFGAPRNTTFDDSVSLCCV